MPFKIWQHPQGEMTVNEYIRRLADQDKRDIDALKKAALEEHANAAVPSNGRRALPKKQTSRPSSSRKKRG